MGGDEVLKNTQAFTETRLDRTRNHLTTWVGHEALHTGDLTDLLRVTTSARVHHHVERVELEFRQGLFHGATNFSVRCGPDLNFFLATLVIRDDASLVLRLSLLRFLLVAV